MYIFVDMDMGFLVPLAAEFLFYLVIFAILLVFFYLQKNVNFILLYLPILHFQRTVYGSNFALTPLACVLEQNTCNN